MSSSPARSVGLAVLLLATGGCAPTLEGPQLTKPPEGFGLDVNCRAARVMLPRDRERGRSRPLTEAERAAFERERSAS